MIRRLIRIAIRLGLLAGIGFALFKLLEARRVEDTAASGSARDPWPPVPAPTPSPTWVPPSDDTCPPTHPVKAKESSKIFHVPGGANYSRTKPDRCYASDAGATADGFTAAKR